jgi:hypothetical protein
MLFKQLEVIWPIALVRQDLQVHVSSRDLGHSRGRVSGLRRNDLFIAVELSTNARTSAREIRKSLEWYDIDLSRQHISSRISLLWRTQIIVPIIALKGSSATFSIEILCNEKTKRYLLTHFKRLPDIAYCYTSVGIILWLKFPGKHLLSYCNHFKALEGNNGVQIDTFHIAPVYHTGRRISDYVRNWDYIDGGFTTKELEIKHEFEVHIA